jgi:hypothetical protein
MMRMTNEQMRVRPQPKEVTGSAAGPKVRIYVIGARSQPPTLRSAIRAATLGPRDAVMVVV